MKTFQLNAVPRTDLGKKAAKALRKDNMIPVVLSGGKLIQFEKNENGEFVYNGKLEDGEKAILTTAEGKGVISTDLAVKFNDVRKLIYTPEIFVIELTYNGKLHKAVLKDIQFHKLNDSILHIDLLEVYDDKPVVMNVPVTLEGHAVGVKAGGKLYLSMKKVKVKGLYSDIPERIVVNVEDIKIGHSIKVSDLHFDKYELVSSKDLVITGVRATRAAATAAATEETEEGAEEAATEAPAAE